MQVNEVISLIANITWLMMFVAAVIFIVIEGVFERDIRKENEDLKAELDEKDEKLRYLSDVRYNFSSRSEIRAFMNDYTNWPHISGSEEPFYSKYCYRFKNNIRLYAFLERISTTPELDKVLYSYEKNVRYFVQVYGWSSLVEVTKDQIERYLMEHRNDVI